MYVCEWERKRESRQINNIIKKKKENSRYSHLVYTWGRKKIFDSWKKEMQRIQNTKKIGFWKGREAENRMIRKQAERALTEKKEMCDYFMDWQYHSWQTKLHILNEMGNYIMEML